MLVPFNTLPDTARLWVYQASRPLTIDELKGIETQASNFIESWTAHQAGLRAGFQVLYNRFVIIAVDENYNDASGCSIDKKVNFIKQVGEELKIDFFNRLQIAYLHNDAIQIAGMHELAGLIKSGSLSDETIMFNNLVSTIEELNNKWKVPVRQSWLQQLVSH